MKNDAILVKALPNFELYVELEGGQKGVFDVKPYIGKGVLKALADEAYFQQVGIAFGAVTWPKEQDIAPSTLEANLRTLNN
jgi:hypothetical protein